MEAAEYYPSCAILTAAYSVNASRTQRTKRKRRKEKKREKVFFWLLLGVLCSLSLLDNQIRRRIQEASPIREDIFFRKKKNIDCLQDPTFFSIRER
jgi:hypothetical protein